MARELLSIAVVLLAAAAGCAAHKHGAHCATQEVWEYKQLYENQSADVRPRYVMPDAPLASCRMEGRCDSPSVRDQTQVGQIDISLAIVVIGVASSMTEARLAAQVRTLNADWNQANINFVVKETQFVSVSGGQCLPAYDSSGRWYTQIQTWKSKYGKNATNHLNIYVSCQNQGNQGTLLGFGTFPWDRDALAETGGIWMNSDFVTADDKTLSHEIGHNLGLRHTFAGVNEVSGCTDPCHEAVHDLFDPAADVVGDWCSDTRATPMNYVCRNPDSPQSCSGTAWGDTPLNNYMSYTPDNCMGQFTDQQIMRAHCWVCDKLRGQVLSGC